MSSFNSFYNFYDNTGTNGWFAVDNGKLVLPDVSVATGSPTVNWGEYSSDTTIDLVNSVRMAFTSATAGDLSISLLAADHADVPTIPGGWTFIGVWEFGALTFDSVDLTFRYDDALAAVLGLDEASLTVFHYEGGNWVDVGTGIDTVNNRISADGLGSFSYFAVGTIPEPATIVLLLAGGVTLALFRKR